MQLLNVTWANALERLQKNTVLVISKENLLHLLIQQILNWQEKMENPLL